MGMTTESVRHYLSATDVNWLAAEEGATSGYSYRVENGAIIMPHERSNALYGLAPLPKLGNFTGWLVVESSALSLDPTPAAQAKRHGERLQNLGALWSMAAEIANHDDPLTRFAVPTHAERDISLDMLGLAGLGLVCDGAEPEYERAICELMMDAAGLSHEEDRGKVLAYLHGERESWYAPVDWAPLWERLGKRGATRVS